MIVTSERTILLGAHVTPEVKEQFRREANRRNMSMSALVAQILTDWLEHASAIKIEQRSNKRDPSGLRDIPLPLED